MTRWARDEIDAHRLAEAVAVADDGMNGG
jgi:hypothetical protein